jgi:hypothetical protein
MHSECQPPLTRVRCFRRAATPPHGLSEIPQGKTCAFRDKAYHARWPFGASASFNKLARLRKYSATPFACTVAASPSSSGRSWCPPCPTKQAATGVCDRVRAVKGATDLESTMMVALPLQSRCFWRRSERSLPKRVGRGDANVKLTFQPTVRHADADLGAKVVTQLTRETCK